MSLDIASQLNQLIEIYRDIDEKYEKSQKHYNNFSCKECDDNCCTTVFYHHTLIEYFYLTEGLDKIDSDRMEQIVKEAEGYRTEVIRKPFDYHTLRIMCPLNDNGLCIVYDNRPLICRIHGVPGILNSPQKGKQEWAGCNRFKEMHGEKADHQLDRTKYYTQIATLESQTRKELMFFQKYKKTIADMILDYSKEKTQS